MAIFCKACNEKIGFSSPVMNLSYSEDGKEVCWNCYRKLEKVILRPDVHSEVEYDAYLNNLDSVLGTLNVPNNCFEYLKQILIKNKNNIIYRIAEIVDDNSNNNNQYPRKEHNQVPNDELINHIKSIDISLITIKRGVTFFVVFAIISIIIGFICGIIIAVSL